MQYTMLRLFLTDRSVGTLFQGTDVFEDISRADFLERELSQDREFVAAKGIRYSYAYIGMIGSVILARLGRKKPEQVTQGPETGFSEDVAPLWHASNILIDISGDRDGQKVAFENQPAVGTPLIILRGLADALNLIADSTWHVDANVITVTPEFWDTVEKYQGRISELSMTFIAPNIFGGKDQTTKALKRLKSENNTQKTTVRISNSDKKLNPDSANIREGIEYLSDGGGSYKMRSGKEVLFDSEHSPVTRKVKDEDLQFSLQKEDQSRWEKLVEYLFKK